MYSRALHCADQCLTKAQVCPSLSFSSQMLSQTEPQWAMPDNMPDNMLGSGVVNAVIMWFVLMVYNYSQINYLLQTVLLYKEASNNQGFIPLSVQSVFFILVFFLCLHSFCPFLPRLKCYVTSNRGQCVLSHPHPFNQHVFGMINVHPTGWRGQPSFSMSH